MGVELFNVQCTTCRARLKVRDAGTIGEIHACPRCGSMVQIIPPAGWQPPESGTPARGPALPASASTEPPAEPTSAPSPASSVDRESVVEPGPPEAAQPVASAATSESTPTTEPEPSLAPPAITPPPLPNEPVADGASAPWWWRPEVAWSAVPVAVLITILFMGWLIHSASEEPDDASPLAAVDPAEASPPEPNLNSPEGAVPSDATPAETAPSMPLATTVGSSASPPALPPLPNTPPTSDPPATNAPPPPSAAPQPTTPPSAPVVPQPDAPSPASPTPPAKTTPSPVVASKGPGLLPESTGLPTSPSAAPSVPPSPSPAPPPQPAVEAIDIPARLNERVEAIDFPKATLYEVINLLAKVSQTPLTCDLDAWEDRGVHPTTPVSLKRFNLTIGELLSGLLAEHELLSVVLPDRLLITDSADDATQQQNVLLPRSTLGSVTPERLAALIEAVLDPAAWGNGGGAGSVKIETDGLRVVQHRALQREVRRLLEGLQQADRGAVTKPRCQRADETLSTPLAVNFPGPAPLEQVLDYVQKQLGWMLILDRGALHRHGVTATAPVSLVAQGGPIGPHLRDALEAQELTLLVRDDRVGEVTTLDEASRRFELEFYTLPAGRGAEQVEALRRAFPDAGWSPAGRAAAAWDVASKRLIVRQTQAWQRRIAPWISEPAQP